MPKCGCGKKAEEIAKKTRSNPELSNNSKANASQPQNKKPQKA